MFNYLLGSIRGKKLAKLTAKLCGDIVNHFIISGLNIKLPDTAFIFKESYSLCLTFYAKANPTYNGALIITSKSILRDWLKHVIQSSTSNYDMTNALDSVIEELESYWKEWIRIVSEKNMDLVGKNTREWKFAVIQFFTERIFAYLDKEYAELPSDSSSFIETIAEDCIKGI
jgi:hypothetical protein